MNTLAIACVAIAGGRQEIPGCLPRFDDRWPRCCDNRTGARIRGRDQRAKRPANVRLRRLIVRDRPLGSGSSRPGNYSDPRTRNRCRRMNLVASAACSFSVSVRSALGRLGNMPNPHGEMKPVQQVMRRAQTCRLSNRERPLGTITQNRNRRGRRRAQPMQRAAQLLPLPVALRGHAAERPSRT